MEHSWKNVPKLGFGLMRLPMLGDKVDIEQFKAMADRFLEAGFTYFDTAYGYINGQSEAAFKEAVIDRHPRDSFTIATKLPAWAGPKTAEEAKQMFWTSLERTGAGYFDFYLLHNVSDERKKVFDAYGIWDFVQERKKEGLIRHAGFSFHDTADVLDKVLTEHPEVDFIQLQINYADWDDNSVQSRLCWETARKHGKPVVIMEPVKGGTLANLPPEVQKPFRDGGLEPVEAALRFAASLDGIITVLSGMSTLEQMEQNLKFMKPFRPLDDRERGLIGKALEALKARPGIPCTACRYCEKGCPQDIAIHQVFAARNTELVYGDPKGAKMAYRLALMQGGRPSGCVGCGQCERTCPQKIRIIDELKNAVMDYED
ncbi:MAG: aldo/keto reductase [Oscillospiraceae bacterium]|nr:aldo/keto reductase [Oscillospiraceae bacterium]